MGKSLQLAVLFLFISALSFAAQSIELIDSLGRTVRLSKLPQKIVISGRAGFMISCASFFFETAPDKLISYSNTFQTNDLRSFFRHIDKNMDNKSLLDTAMGIEEIAALNPDLVLMKEFEARKYEKLLAQLKIPVVFFNLESPDKFFQDIERLGKIFGEPKRVKKIADFYNRWQKAIADSINKKEKSPRCLTIFVSKIGGAASFNVPPKNWIQTKMIHMAGGIPVWEKSCTGNGWQKVGFEQIAAWDPEYIFVTAYNADVEKSVKELKNNSFWKLLRAYKENKIFAFPEDFNSWDQPDSKWILGLYWLAGRINPDSYQKLKKGFADLYKEFYKLYGFDDTSISQIKRRGDLL